MLYPLDHHASPKKDASSRELSNTVFSHSSNVRIRMMMSWCENWSWWSWCENWHWTNGKRQCCLTLGLMHPFLGMHDGLEDKACLLTTDTGDAGSSPHVARRFFQWCSMTNIAIYIIKRNTPTDWISKFISQLTWVFLEVIQILKILKI